MRYTVTWLPSALKELANIWNNAPNRGAVSAAANRIDQALSVDAETKAVPFYGDWLMVDPPLAVVFRIDRGDCKVQVTQVWYK